MGGRRWKRRRQRQRRREVLRRRRTRRELVSLQLTQRGEHALRVSAARAYACCSGRPQQPLDQLGRVLHRRERAARRGAGAVAASLADWHGCGGGRGCGGDLSRPVALTRLGGKSGVSPTSSGTARHWNAASAAASPAALTPPPPASASPAADASPMPLSAAAASAARRRRSRREASTTVAGASRREKRISAIAAHSGPLGAWCSAPRAAHSAPQ